jgi:hypothetical protein
MIMADVRRATAGLVLMATDHVVLTDLTSRQCSEVPGELLSRRGYEITMVDIPMMRTNPDDSCTYTLASGLTSGAFSTSVNLCRTHRTMRSD